MYLKMLIVFLLCFLSLNTVCIGQETKTAHFYFEQGMNNQRNGDYFKALEFFKKAVSIRQDYAGAYFMIGKTYFKLDNFDDAILSLEKAVAIKKDYIEAYCLLGDAYLRVKKYDKCEQSYKEALKYSNRYKSIAYTGLSFLFEEHGKYDKAIAVLEESILLNPSKSKYYQLGRLCFQIEKYRDAVKYLNYSVSIATEFPDIHYFLGLSYLQLDNMDSALQEYRVLKKIDHTLARDLYLKFNSNQMPKGN